MSALLSRLRALHPALAALILTIASLTSVGLASTTAQADTLICDQYGSTTIQGKYVVQNNRWGTSEQQCINVTSSGFQLTTANGSVPTNGAPKSYPSIFNGCHYTNCSPGTNLPKQISTISSAPSSISYTYVSNATYNASFDIWLDPSPKKDGVSATEIMIWLNKVGSIQPIGSKTGTATVAGRTWDVWTGNNGGNDVISFVAPSAVSSMSFDVLDFVRQTISKGMAQQSWYITSIQAGFEPWINGAGLAVNSFSSTVNSGTSTPPPTDPTTPPPTNPSGSCKVTNTATSWPGGYTSNITVTNTGSTAINGWKVGFTLPSGQTVTNAWNATVSPNSGAVTATNTSSNAQIAAGASQSFGFQGTYSGSFTKPGSYTLNGTACTVG
ncbi:cellulose binding domain-containing protein [Streptomyces sp. NPDC056600]|uniref:GH12 family glycosyl hydrolase domain-containing protein n=1 Tax=Streptomyces sp. NPDC056600 TaxID=3345874 RepID=UPI00369A248C